MKNNRTDHIFILSIIGLVFIFFGPVIFDTFTFYYRDIFRYYHPVKFFAAESIQNGHIPFWNPYSYCGLPFLATLQQALFYPLSLLCYLLPFSLGFKYFFIIHFLLGGVFLYLLCRHLKLDGFSSLTSVIIFIFSGYLVSTLNLLTTLSAVIWVPLIFLFFKIAVEKKSIWFGILVGILLSFQFFSGQPDVLFTTILILFIFLLYKAIIFLSNNSEDIPKDYYVLLRMFMVLAISLICLILITAVQSIPFKELINYSTRSSTATFERLTYWSLHPLELIVLVIPSFSRILLAGSEKWFGQIWLRNFYVGILPLVLLVLAFRYKRKENLRFFAILGVIALILTLGKFTPFYNFLFKFVPGFNLVRYPIKFMFLVMFSLAILAGMGMQYFIDELKEEKHFSSFIKVMMFVFLILSFGFLLLYFKQEQIADLFRRHFLMEANEIEIRMFNARFPRLIRDYFFMLSFFGTNLILFSLISRGKIALYKFKYLYSIVLLISLGLVSYNIEPLVNVKFYKDKGGNLGFIEKNDTGYERFYLTPKSEQEITSTVSYLRYTYYDALLDRRAVVLPNTNVPYHIFSAGGYGSMRIRRYNNFMGLVLSQPSPMDAPLLNLLNIKYLISLWDIDSVQFKLLRTDTAKIYENQYSLPRVFIVPKAVLITEEKKISAKLGNKEFNPTKEVVIETSHPSVDSNNSAQAEGHAIITSYRNNEVDIKASLTNPGWLLLTDTYYPGWKVYVDGKEDKIYKADYLFRAVYLDAGKHNVTFIYEPTLFRWAMVITVIFVLILGVFSIYFIKSIVNKEV